MQSFDTKDSNTLESFDRKFESFNTKDSEVEQSGNDFVESFDRKLEGFDTKDSEVKQSDNEVAQNFDRKFKSTDEEALSDSESFDTFSTKDSHVSVPNFDKFNTHLNANEQSSTQLNCACSRSEKSKADGRRKPRSQKQIQAYKRNFSSKKFVELRINELDLRLRHLQSMVVSLLRR